MRTFYVGLGLILILSGCGVYRAQIDTSSSGSASSLTAGSNINGANGSLTATITAGSYNGSQICTMSDTNLVASNIKYGVSIFGVTGTNADLLSNQFREKGATQVSVVTESLTNAATPYTNSPTGYRAVPIIAKDDDGSSGVNVNLVDRTGWAATTCGTVGTIDQRIADCAANGTIGPNATWDGGTNGHNGEGIWKLVSRTGNVSGGKGREVWRDERTKLLWSSLVGTSLNWCKASDSNFIAGNPAAENDSASVCTNVSNQNTAGLAVSACFEDGGVSFTDVDGNIDSAGKAGLNLSSTPLVAWRLPSMADFQQANINGIRFILPDVSSTPEWSTTIRSANRISAQLFSADVGSVSVQSRANPFNVRCVGR